MTPRQIGQSRRNTEIPVSDSARLRHARLRPTAIALSVLKAVESLASPASVDEIYVHLLAADFQISVASVYRVLASLEQAGLVQRHWVSRPGGPKAVYARRPAFLAQHRARSHSLHCLACGSSVAIEDGALEALLRFTGLEPQAARNRYLVIETDGCSNCGPGQTSQDPTIRITWAADAAPN